MMPEGLSPAWVLVGSVVGRQAASAVGMIGSCCCWLLAPRYRVSRAVNWVGHVIIHQTEMTKDTALAWFVRLMIAFICLICLHRSRPTLATIDLHLTYT